MYKLYKECWVDNQPPHKSEQLTRTQCKQLLNGGKMVRCISHFDKLEPTGFWFVIKDSFGGMEELSSKMRNQVRKALKTYDIRIATKDEMLKWGLHIQNSAIAHYKVKAAEVSQDAFARRINEAGDDIEYWMCFKKSDGEPVAFSINYLYTDCCDYGTMKADPAYLNSTYPFYGLLYEMNRYYLEERGMKYVCDGARSITEHSNIQPFLEQKFNFRKAYCDLTIHYVWYLALMIKLLYPFRRWIPVRSVASLLRQEAMAKGDY